MTSGIRSAPPIAIDITASDGGISSDRFESYLGPAYWQPEGNKRLCICTILFSPSLRLQELSTILMGIAHFLKYRQCAPTYKQLRQRLINEAQNTSDQARFAKIKDLAGKLVLCTGTDKELDTEILKKTLPSNEPTNVVIETQSTDNQRSTHIVEYKVQEPENKGTQGEKKDAPLIEKPPKKQIRFVEKKKPVVPSTTVRLDTNGVPLPPLMGPPPPPPPITVNQTNDSKGENTKESDAGFDITSSLQNRKELKKVEIVEAPSTPREGVDSSKPRGSMTLKEIQMQKEKNSQVDEVKIKELIKQQTLKLDTLKVTHGELKDPYTWPEKQARARAEEKKTLQLQFDELKKTNGDKKPTSKMMQLESKIKTFDNTSPAAYKKELEQEISKLERNINELSKQIEPK